MIALNRPWVIIDLSTDKTVLASMTRRNNDNMERSISIAYKGHRVVVYDKVKRYIIW